MRRKLARRRTVKAPEIMNMSETCGRSGSEVEGLMELLREVLVTKKSLISEPKNQRAVSAAPNIYDTLNKILDLLQVLVDNTASAMAEPQKERVVNINARRDVIVNAVAEQDIDTEARQQVGNVSNMTMKGEGSVCVMGENNQLKVWTRINKKFERTDLRELGQAFALLQGEIGELGLPEKVSHRAIRAVEDAEDEAADNSPVANTIVDSLCRVKRVLETSGQAYDAASGWGKRFDELVNILTKFIPAITTLFSTLSDKGIQ